MVDLEDSELLSESEVRISGRFNFVPATDLFPAERESLSSMSIQKTKYEDVKNNWESKNLSISMMSGTAERCKSSSWFLYPSLTPKTSSESIGDVEIVYKGKKEILLDGSRILDIRSGCTSGMSAIHSTANSEHPSTPPSVIITSLGMSKEDEPLLSNSGTPIITGIINALPDTVLLTASFSKTKALHLTNCDSREHSNIFKGSEIFNLTGEQEDSSEDYFTSVDRLRHHPSLRSRRGSELRPPREIWITGGPAPGLYVNDGWVNGRPKWLGTQAKICWSISAKAWLLVPIGAKENGCVLAILYIDSNNPCITTKKWRVSRNTKKGVGNSPCKSWAFKTDPEMVCTKYFGSSRSNQIFPLIVDSTIVLVKSGIGIVRFIGPLEDISGTFAGIELFTPTGIHGGVRNDLFYFEANPKHGVFVRIPNGVKKVFGEISDKFATFIENLVITVSSYKDISKLAIERIVEIIILIKEDETIFFGTRLNVLGIILFYELLMS